MKLVKDIFRSRCNENNKIHSVLKQDLALFFVN